MIGRIWDYGTLGWAFLRLLSDSDSFSLDCGAGYLSYVREYIVSLVPCLACAAMKEFEMTQLALNCDCEELWRLRDADVGPSFFNVLYSGKGEL